MSNLERKYWNTEGGFRKKPNLDSILEHLTSLESRVAVMKAILNDLKPKPKRSRRKTQ